MFAIIVALSGERLELPPRGQRKQLSKCINGQHWKSQERSSPTYMQKSKKTEQNAYSNSQSCNPLK